LSYRNAYKNNTNWASWIQSAAFGQYKENEQRGSKMEIITPGHIIEELQRLTKEMEKGANALYDAECKLADADSAYDRAVSLAFINNSGTVADRQAVAKLQAV
jgi:hypothetical protein